MNLTFGLLCESDASHITEIVNWFMECSYDQIKAFLSEKQNIAIVAKLDERVVGLVYGYSLTCFDKEKPQFFIYSVDVHNDHQNTGYGSQLVAYAVEWARNNGFGEAFVMTHKDNPRACKVYEKAGMTHSESDCERMYEIEYE
ncbi:MAG: GNAT family N-acetyltransferase [Defluviitaleaceae bacterium]|nr:GNAT family N-acetyltransferase [Defluviitaleaceae bacterium]